MIFNLWYKPRCTIKNLIKNKRGHNVAVCVAILFGLVQGGRFFLADPEFGYACFFYGAFLGYLGLYFFAWLLRNFGRWMGGHSQLKEVRVALGWGILPWLLLFTALVIKLIWLLDVATVANYYWIFFLGFLYGFVVLLIALATALHLSTLRTFLCLSVTFIVSVFPFTLLFQVLKQIA